MPRAQFEELMRRPRLDPQSTPLIQFAGDTTLNVSARGWLIVLSLPEALAILEWLQVNEGEIRARLHEKADEVLTTPG